MILKDCISVFITHEIIPRIFTIKDISDADYTKGDHKWTIQSGYDDKSMKTKLTQTRFGSTSGTFKFDEESFFITFLGFTPNWDYKPTNASHTDSPGLYTFDKFLNLKKK